jgi:branched-chain amino acid transport system ATP-binding protein
MVTNAINGLLLVNNIDVFYGDIQVIWGISFQVNAGEVVALLGANGAGKSTTLRAISGLVPLRRGEILFKGQPLHRTPAHQIIEYGIAHVPEARRLFPELTVKENLIMGSLKQGAREEREESLQKVFKTFPRLAERARQLAGTLSGGEQQMLAVGRGLMSKPKLLMLDEPSLGLAPIVVNQIFEVVQMVREQGVTVLLVEQNVSQTLQVADRAYVLETGRITLEGPCNELTRNNDIIKAYFGM